jgi:hypothetical protein
MAGDVMGKNALVVINERRQKLWTLLTRGMNTYEIGVVVTQFLDGQIQIMHAEEY